MSSNKRPRKPYRPQKRISAKHYNPVLNAIKRKDQQTWIDGIESWPDGSEKSTELTQIVEMLAAAMKALYAYEDGASLGDQILQAMHHCAEMARDGGKWQAQHGELIADGLHYSLQILQGVDVGEFIEAMAWSRRIQQAAGFEVTA